MDKPLYAAIMEFVAKNPEYKITADEFVGLVNILSREVLKKH